MKKIFSKHIPVTSKSFLVFFCVLFSYACYTGSELRQQPINIYDLPEGSEHVYYETSPEKLGVTVYPAPSDGQAEGAVIFIHGGAWKAGGSDMPLFSDWYPLIKKANLRAFSIEHRVAPAYRGRDQIEDVIKAIKYIQSNAKLYRFPPDKIGLIGFSSGGHLAVMASLLMTAPDRFGRPGARYLKGVVAYYAPLSLQALYLSGTGELRNYLLEYLPVPPEDLTKNSKTQEEKDATLEEFRLRTLKDISPSEHLHKYAPSLMLIHGLSDRLVAPEQSLLFYENCKTLGVPSVYIPVPKARHNFNQSRSSWARSTEKKSIEFLVKSMESK